MMSLELSACRFKNSRLSPWISSITPSAGEDCNRAKLLFKLACAFLSFSNRTTRAAPLEAASKPKAPVPAKRSIQRNPDKSCPSQLNKVSRMRSVVGRKPGKSITVSKRLRQLPPIMRTFLGGSDLRVFTGLIIFRSQHYDLHAIHRKIFLERISYLLQSHCLYLLSPDLHRIERQIIPGNRRHVIE